MSGIIKDPEVDDNENDEINANLNKKVKKVTVGTDLRNIKIKSIVLVVVFLLIFGTTSFGLNIYISQTAFLID